GGLARPLKEDAPVDLFLEKGRRFGEYEILEEIGRGGMGIVYKARQRPLNRLVALKMVLHGEFASRSEVERFRREAEAVAGFDHPNLVPVYEVGELESFHYFSMRLLDGGSLAAPRLGGKLVSRLFEPRETAKLLEKTARAVHHAHERGILHRDLKPANILLDSAGEPHVSDFGLARRLEMDSTLTRTGEVLGTPSYMAPEQATGGGNQATPLADVYSLGAILYDLLTGRPPFEGPTPMETLRQVISSEPLRPRSRRPGVPMDLETICLKCLEKDPMRRYASARELADELARFLAGVPITARRISRTERVVRWSQRNPALATLVMVLILVAAGTTVAAFRFSAERDRAIGHQWEAHLAEARARALSGSIGQRVEGLKAVEEAADIRASTDLRNAAIACLALTDLRTEAVWEGFPPGTLFVAFDPTMTRYARCDAAGAISVREVHGDREIAAIPPRREVSVSDMIFRRGGQVLAARYGTWGLDGEVIAWDLGTLSVIGEAPYTVGKECFDLTADATRACLVFNDGSLREYEIKTKTELHRVELADGATRLRYDSTGRRAALALWQRKVQVWDLEESRKLFDQPGLDFDWHPDGDLLAVASPADDIELWSVSRREMLCLMRGSDNGGNKLAFSSSGNLLASSSWDATLRLWDLSGTEILRAPSVSSRPQFSAGDTLLGPYRMRNSLGLWKLEKSTVAASLMSVGHPACPPLWSDDGKVIVLRDRSRLRFWSAEKGRDLVTLPARDFGFVGLLPGEGLLYVRGDELHLRRIDWQKLGEGNHAEVISGASEKLADLPREYEKPVQNGCLSLNGRYFAYTRSGSALSVIDLEDGGRSVRTVHNPASTYHSLHPEGRWVASGPLNGLAVKVFDLETGEEVLNLHSRTIPVLTASTLFSPDGGHLIVATGEEFTVYETGGWKAIRRFPRLDPSPHPPAMTWSPDGKLLALALSYRQVHLIEFSTGEELAVLATPRHKLLSYLRFSPDSTRLVSQDNDGGVAAWELSRLREELRALGLDWEQGLQSSP
ncbi:MAG TPA: serine/threonine-protein kinase, partial [Planctomycetota bacterium]|nr:serine/threonine-protein kinase [Planctomycetota bacterium]